MLTTSHPQTSWMIVHLCGQVEVGRHVLAFNLLLHAQKCIFAIKCHVYTDNRMGIRQTCDYARCGNSASSKCVYEPTTATNNEIL